MPVKSSDRRARIPPDRGLSIDQLPYQKMPPEKHNSIPPVPAVGTNSPVADEMKPQVDNIPPVDRFPTSRYQLGSDIMKLIKGGQKDSALPLSSQAVKMNDPRERPTIPKGKLQPAPKPKVKSTFPAAASVRSGSDLSLGATRPPELQRREDNSKNGTGPCGAAIKGIWGTVSDSGHLNGSQEGTDPTLGLSLPLPPAIVPSQAMKEANRGKNRAGIGASGGKWADRLRERKT
jgi:hypothetical protein